MSFQGWPDLQQPMHGGDYEIFFPYGGSGSHVVVPHHLEIAETPSGRPDFLLELVRGANPLLPPKPYGVLDFRLRPQFRMDDALVLLRISVPGATLGYPSFVSGFLALEPAAQTDLPADLRRPISLGWNGLAVARFVLKISTDSAALIRQALTSNVLAVLAVSVVEIEGVSPRVPIKVGFQSAELLTALAKLGTDRIVAWQDVATLFRGDLKNVPITLDGTIDDRIRDDFAEAMADRIRLRFASLIPSPEGQPKAYLSLIVPGDAEAGSLEWDLAEPTLVPRPLVLQLNPIEAAQRLVAAEGLASVVRETIVPPIQTGAHRVSVAANLPAERPGVLACGVTLRAAPRPPWRVQALIETADLAPPVDSATLLLRLSPKEELQYTYATYLALQIAGSVQRLDGKESVGRDEHLDITTGDFPVDFVPLAASPALLEQASIQGACRGTVGDGKVELRFELTAARPALALAFPKGASGIVCDALAQSIAGPATLPIALPVAGGLSLGLSTFREYGAHTIEVECVFEDPDAKLTAIDLLPQGRPESPEEIGVLFFTPANSRREWSYLVRSLFESGYRYREHRGETSPPAAWSGVQSPFEPLRIHAGALQTI